MSQEIDLEGIDQKNLRPKIDEIRALIKKHPVVKEMFEEHDVDLNEIDLIPMCFAKLPVSARTEHGIIYFNIKLAEDGFDNDDHYMVHEITHFLQQTTGDKPTKGSTKETYLDNPAEVEGFQNQTEYLADTRGKEKAEDYVNQVLDHHEVDGKKREEKEEELTLNVESMDQRVMQLTRMLMGAE
jgi:hypothetical protein